LKFVIFATTGNVLDEPKEQFISTAKRLKCKYSIFDLMDLSRLFIAYGFICPRDANRIVAGRCKCGYSPKRRILNIFQIESIKELMNAHNIGQKAGLIINPPGGGKTRIAAADAKNISVNNLLYIAHTHEILDVAKSEFEALFDKNEITYHTSVVLQTVLYI